MKSTFSRTAMLVVKLLAPAGLLLAGGSPSHAGDVKAGGAKAMMCQACHGLDGLSKTPDAPNIAGQTEPYLIASCRRTKPVCERTTRCRWLCLPCPTQDIEDLAAYYSTIEIKIVKVPGE